MPIYWKLLSSVPATEILTHRLIWSFAFSATLVVIQGRWSEIRLILRSKKQILILLASGVAIYINWFIFIWAVNSGHVIETSLGYFILPLVNVLLGRILFGERLRPLQWLALSLAAAGVLNLTLRYGSFPWIALGLCASFAAYGLLRKVSRAGPLTGLLLESAAFAPFALIYVFSLNTAGASSFTWKQPSNALLLIGSGIVTAIPLLWFAHAARNLKLSTLGLLQYLSPTLSFLLGTVAYGEPFTRQHLITFGCIWTGLTIYTFDARNRSGDSDPVARQRD